MKINGSEISVIYQGLINESFITALKKTRSVLPEVEIILSTWETNNFSLLEELKPFVDAYVLNAPVPDIYKDKLTEVNHNVHRQVISTLQGIKRASRPFILKLRVDCSVDNLNFFLISEIKTNERLLKNKINIINQGTVDPLKWPYLFHVSDLVMFGCKEDLLGYWEQSMSYNCHTSLLSDIRFKWLGGHTGFRFTRSSVEQQIFLDFLYRHKKINHFIGYIDEIGLQNSYISEKFISTHFSLFDVASSGIDFPSRLTSNGFIKKAYTNSQLQKIECFFIKQPIVWRYFVKRYIAIFLNKYLLCFFRKIYYKGILSLFALILKKLGFNCFKVKK